MVAPANPNRFPSVKEILAMTPEELQRAEWRAVAHTLKECQRTMEAGCPAGRYSWVDASISIAQGRGEEPNGEEERSLPRGD